MPTCFKCRTSEHVRKSQGSHAYDFLLRLIGLSPFRCDACKRRFFRFADSSSTEKQSVYTPPAVRPASPDWPAGLPSRASLDREPIVRQKSA